MRTYPQLIELHRALKYTRVLSVYVDGTERDPANRHVWRARVTHDLDDLRKWLEGSSHAERTEFEKCAVLLGTRLRHFAGNLRAPGWVAFITAHGASEATPLPVPVRTQTVWSTGISMGPYVRALKEARPVVILLTDSASARLYRYHFGQLSLVESLHAHAEVREPTHMGDAPRQGFHSGTRGMTGSDQAQRSRLQGTDRMLRDAAKRAAAMANGDSWIVVGGIPEMSRRAMSMLPAETLGRTTHEESFDIHSSEAEIVGEARAAVSRLRDAADMARIREIADGVMDTGLGTLGPERTRHALDQKRVRALYFTHRFLDEHPAETEDAVRAAAEQGAIAEEVSGSAAAELDRHGGMAASLRYRIPSEAAAS
jgi:hypothetical protein